VRSVCSGGDGVTREVQESGLNGRRPRLEGLTAGGLWAQGQRGPSPPTRRPWAVPQIQPPEGFVCFTYGTPVFASPAQKTNVVSGSQIVQWLTVGLSGV